MLRDISSFDKLKKYPKVRINESNILMRKKIVLALLIKTMKGVYKSNNT